MKPATKEQIRAINAILAKRKLMDMKADIIRESTGGRTTHSTELYASEAYALLKSLNINTATDPGKQRMIRKLFAMAHEIGWIPKTGRVDQDGDFTTESDRSRVYGWIKKFGYLKKDLSLYTYNELPKLVTQFELGPYTHYLSNI